MSSEVVYFPDPMSCADDELRVAVRDCAEASNLSAVRSAPFVKINELPDEHLLAQIRDGAKDALSHLFRRHARAVRNVAFRILRNEAEADDLVQDVFLFLFCKAALFDPARGSAATWIIHVTYHRAFDRRRYLNSRHFYSSQEMEESVPGVIDRNEEIPAYERSLEGNLGREVAAHLHEQLTPEQLEIVHLYFFEGYSLKEIAKRTGRSLVNVRSYYYRGLERLRKFVLPKEMGSK